MQAGVLMIVIVYLIGMLAVGLYANTRLNKTSEDYLLASRALPAIMVAASLSANNIGGGSCVGVASRVYGPWGISAGWYVLAAGIGIVPMAFLAKALRKTLAFTIPEVVGKRFGAPSHVITSVVNILAMFALTAGQMGASGTIISAITGLPLNTAILAAGVVCIAYTVVGGLWADAISDFVQWIVLFFGLLIALPFVISNAGGWSAIVSKVPPAKLSLTALGWPMILSLCFNYFVTFVSGPEMVSRIYAAKNEEEGFKATLMSALFMGVYAFVPALIGLAAFAVFPTINGNLAMATAATKLVPPVIGGLICSAIISATLSSADSDMLCASTIIVKDLYQKYIHPDCPDRTIMTMTKAFNVVVGLLALWVALFQINIITLNTFAFMLRSAGPFAAFALGLVWKGASRNSGIVSIILGSIGGIWWQSRPADLQFGIMPIVIGSAISCVAFVLTTVAEKAMGGESAPMLEDIPK
ncbi:MAG: sodium:solute symporter family protein [Ignavibacteriales bacterium]